MLDGADGTCACDLSQGLPMRRVAMLLLLFFPTISACVEYPAIGKDGRVWVIPDDYRVDPNLYPKYRAIQDFQPPDLLPNPHNDPHLKMPVITTDYVWEVRHNVRGKLWIFSKQYREQECRLERCYGSFVYEISISPDGRAEPGWRQIENPKYVVMRGDRAIPLSDARYDLSWGDEPLFKIIKE